MAQLVSKNTSVLNGLSEKEARHLLALHGANELVVKKKVATWKKLFATLKNPLVLILFVAATLSALFGEAKSAVLIVAIIIFSSLLNFYQEQKSSHEAERLQEKLSLMTMVVRGGEKKEIKATLIVPGDIVMLSAGDIVPADSVVVASDDLFLNESTLTGESFPIEKSPLPERSPHQELATTYAGTTVVSGSGYVRVLATGVHTEFGKISQSMQQDEPVNAFESGINSFGILIVKMTVFIVLAVFLVNTFKPLFFHGSLSRALFIESFLFALAIAVGLTPELLPMIMSINMAKGSLRMAKKGVIVKRLNAIPDFGSIDILCTDKTGTLTEDKITLVKYLDVDGEISDTVLKHAYLNSEFQTGLKSPLDEAVLAFKHVRTPGYKKIDEIPYDFNRKRLSVIVQKEQQCVLISKGQPEEILKICSSYAEHGSVTALNDHFLQGFKKVYDDLSANGYKALAVAYRDVKMQTTPYSIKQESHMTLLGLIGFYDPPKTSAARTVQEMKRYGVEIKIITGDNEMVTEKVCRELKLDIKGTIVGEEVAMLSDSALAHHAENNTIFARCNPEQKRRIISALRAGHHVVGYLGDGINDAPSLKAADIGISVSNAVDVAKESADIILSHKSLHELTEGIIEGRKTFGNTMKYLMMGLSSNFGNMFSLIGAALTLPFLPILPYQVLLNNSLYDLSQTTIPSDRVDEEYVERPKKWDIQFMKRFMIVFGLLSSVFDLLTFYFLYGYFHLPAAAFQTGWFVESLATQTLVIYIIRTRRFFLRSRPSYFLLATTLSVATLGFILPYTFLGDYFGFVPLSSVVIGTIGMLVVAYLVLVEIAKHFFYNVFHSR